MYSTNSPLHTLFVYRNLCVSYIAPMKISLVKSATALTVIALLIPSMASAATLKPSSKLDVGMEGSATVGGWMAVAINLPNTSTGTYPVLTLAGAGTEGTLHIEANPLTEFLVQVGRPTMRVSLAQMTLANGTVTTIKPGKYTIKVSLYDTYPFEQGTFKLKNSAVAIQETTSKKFAIDPGGPASALIELKQYVTPAGTKTLRLPKGWGPGGLMLEEKTNSNISFAANPPNGMGISFSFRKKPTKSLEEEVQSQYDNLANFGAQSLSKTQTKVSGKDAYFLEWKSLSFGEMTHYKRLVVVTKKHMYMISASTLEKDWAKSDSMLTQSLLTLKPK